MFQYPWPCCSGYLGARFCALPEITMLGVVVWAVQVSHEPHFTIIREVLPPSKKQQKHAERQASNHKPRAFS